MSDGAGEIEPFGMIAADFDELARLISESLSAAAYKDGDQDYLARAKNAAERGAALARQALRSAS
jgi:hypothetical protein